MKPLEKLASEYANLQPKSFQQMSKIDFLEGARAALATPELAGLVSALEAFALSEKNQNRLDQVDEETCRMIILHGNEIAQQAIEAFRKMGGG